MKIPNIVAPNMGRLDYPMSRLSAGKTERTANPNPMAHRESVPPLTGSQ